MRKDEAIRAAQTSQSQPELEGKQKVEQKDEERIEKHEKKRKERAETQKRSDKGVEMQERGETWNKRNKERNFLTQQRS
jgi:Mg-chelatase subunit ChlI